MKMRPILVILSLTLITGLLGWLFFKQRISQTLGVISPLGEGSKEQTAQYRFVFDKKTTSQYPPNEYFPSALLPKYTDGLDVTAKAYAVMDRKSRELLLSKNLTQETPIASIARAKQTRQI